MMAHAQQANETETGEEHSDCTVNISSLIDCVMCGTQPCRLCTICRSCGYCSKECQEADWPTHKLLCKQYRKQGTRPSSQHRRAILFPQDKEKPYMVWVQPEEEPDDLEPDGTLDGMLRSMSVRASRRRANISPVAGFLGRDRPEADHLLIQPISRYGRDAGPVLEVVFRDAFLHDGSKPNRSLAAATATLGGLPHEFRGSIVILQPKDASTYADINLAAYHYALEYIMQYKEHDVEEVEENNDDPQLSLEDRDYVMGVKIACDGEQKRNGGKLFLPVRVRDNHPMRQQDGRIGDVSAISRLVDIPIRACKLPSLGRGYETRHGVGGSYGIYNQAATYLFRQLEVNLPDVWWGMAPTYWCHDVGNVLLIREDGKDMTVEQAELLSRFCQFKISPIFQGARERDGIDSAIHQAPVTRASEEAVKFLTPENLEIFQEELRKCKEEGANFRVYFNAG